MSNDCGEDEDDRVVLEGNGKQKRTGHENDWESQAVCLSRHDTESVAAAAVPAGVRSSSFVPLDVCPVCSPANFLNLDESPACGLILHGPSSLEQ